MLTHPTSDSDVGEALRLPIVTEAAASGETGAIYQSVRANFGLGFVPEVFQLLGTRPRFLRNLWETYRSLFDEGVLPRETKELIATFVAKEAACQYCVGAHSLLAEMIGARPEIVAATRADSPRDMPVEEKLQALMELISLIDHAAYRIVDGDMSRLRDLGWNDAELIEAIWTACVFNAIVRLVDTFGLSFPGVPSSHSESQPSP